MYEFKIEFGNDSVVMWDLILMLSHIPKLSFTNLTSPFTHFHPSTFATLIFWAYSDRRLFTGFITAARIACELTVSKAITMVTKPAIPNIHQLTGVRYAKLSSHLFMAHQETGVAIMKAMTTSRRKSFDNN
jgi:hypothetical protein